MYLGIPDLGVLYPYVKGILVKIQRSTGQLQPFKYLKERSLGFLHPQ